MKKNVKLMRIISFVLAAALLLGIFPASALDTTEDFVIEVFDEEKIKLKAPKEIEPKYENYTIEKLPKELKETLNLDESALWFDTNDAEDPYSLTTVNDDGTKTLRVFGEPVKYIDEETDKVEFIDTTLTVAEDGENAFQCTTNSKKSYFPKDISKGVLLTNGKKSVAMTPVISETKKNGKIKYKKVKIKGKNHAQYEDVFGEGTSLQYIPTVNGIKENIVLEEYNGTNAFSYIIDAKKLVPKETEGTTITFIDPETEEEVFKIDETFIYDSRYNTAKADESCVSYNNYYTVEKQKNGKYLLTTTIDKAFLESPDTVYPVTVDPELKWVTVTNNPVSFTSVSSEGGTSTNGYVGREDTVKWYTYLRLHNFERYFFYNCDLINEVQLSVHLTVNPIPVDTTVKLKRFANDTHYFGDNSYTATLSHANDMTDLVSTGAFSTCVGNAFDITDEFINWLETDLSNGNSTFIPGFYMYQTSVNSLYQISNEDKPFIRINYVEDNSLEEDLYYIRSGKKYLYAKMEAENDIQIYWSEEEQQPTANKYKWRVQKDAASGLYRIETYLTSPSAMKNHYFCNDGTDVSLKAKQDTTRQQWRIVKNISDKNVFRILSNYLENGKRIDAITIASGSNIESRPYVENYTTALTNQHWVFDVVPTDKKFSYSVRQPGNWPLSAAQSGTNLIYGKTPITLEYKTKGNMITTGSGVAAAYVGSSVTDGSSMTDGIINSYNIDIRGYTLTQKGGNGYIRYVKHTNGAYRNKGELYLDIVYYLGEDVQDIRSIWLATNTLNSYYKIGSFKVYVANAKESIFYTKNLKCNFDECDNMWSGVMNVNFKENVEGRYIGIRITQGVLEKDWSAEEAEHAYARIRDIAVFTANTRKYKIENYYDNGLLTRWNATASMLKGSRGIPSAGKFAKEFFSQLEYNGENLGIEMSFETVSIYESVPDKCNKSLSAIKCNCSDADHVKEQNLRDDFVGKKAYSESPRIIPALWTGHTVVNDYNQNGTIEPNEIINDGAMVYEGRLFMLNKGYRPSNQSSEFLDFNTFEESESIHFGYIHELCHTLGAVDSYCFGGNGLDRCQNQNCATCYPENHNYSKECIMSNMVYYDLFFQDTENIFSWWKAYDISEWLCEGCKEDIYNFLNSWW